MPGKSYAGGSSVVADIGARLRLLSALSAFLVLTLMAIILGFLYEPLGGLLDILPHLSVNIILLMVLVLTIVVFSLSRVITRKVENSIRLYSGRLDSILNFTRDVRGEIYIDRLLEKIVDSALALTRSGAGAILLLDEDGLVFKVARGPGLAGLSGKSVPADKGIAGWVVGHGTPLYVEDVKKTPGFVSSHDGLSRHPVGSALCVPLRTGDRVTGVIELDNKRDGLYDDVDVELVSYLSEQAVISIERASFYEDQRNYEVHITDMLIDLIDRSLPREIYPGRRGHSRRVAQYASMMGKAVGMPETEQRKLYFASLLHDLGFLKSASGDAAGKDMFRLHPVSGYEMLNSINFYKDIAPFVLHHHERVDGQGFPEQREGPDIPLQSRIIAVADAFDSALSGRRREGETAYLAAFDDLRSRAGTELDHSLVELLIAGVDSTYE